MMDILERRREQDKTKYKKHLRGGGQQGPNAFCPDSA